MRSPWAAHSGKSGSVVTMHTAAERPDLWARGIDSALVWPEYNLHGDVLNQWWGLLDEELAEFQFVLYDDAEDLIVAEGHTGPFGWDGRDVSLPDGIDAAIAIAFAARRSGAPVNTLCALAAETPRDGQRRGMAVEILSGMRTLAARHGLRHLVAPVRPSWKERYPLTPIERYVGWRRPDGELLDPWMRVHERLGARVSTPLPESMLITGTVAEWESWTGLMLPESGEYVFPGGLAPLTVDVAADRCSYWEPNVWMVHPDIDPSEGGPSGT
jgi:hypothetical protein